MTDWLAAAGLLWAAGVAGATGLAVWRARPRPRPAAPPATPRVLVLRPCAGADPWLLDSLEGLAEAIRPERLVVRHTAAAPDDPAWPVARAAADTLAGLGLPAAAEVVPPRHPNHKVAQLAGAAARAGAHDVVLVADGDVDLRGVDLTALVAPLTGPDPAAAAWSPVAETDGTTPGDRASAAVLSGSLHAFPLLAGLDPRGLVGKLFAVRADALAEVGGFAGLASVLGEDMELARRLRLGGRRVVSVPLGARAVVRGRSLGDVAARLARWVTVIRTQRPGLLLSYPGLFLATGPLTLVAAGVASTAPPAAAGILLLAWGARLTAAAAARRLAGRPGGRLAPLVDTLLGDTVLAVAVLRALATTEVRWRGRRLKVARGGRLAPVAE